MRNLTIMVLCLGLGLFACKKKEEQKAPPGGKAAGGEKVTGAEKATGGEKKPAAAWAVKNLGEKMGGLTIEVPADANVADTSADAPNVMISSNECTVMVSTVTPAYPDSFDKAVAAVEKAPGNKFKAWGKKEQQEGGWYLEWTAGSMADETRVLYGVARRITAGDKQYECTRNSTSPEQAACVAKACMSLKKGG